MNVPRTAGSTWLWTYKGKLWPVVLCDDNVPPQKFRDLKLNPFSVPAVLLGKHIFIWVTDTGLQEFDPSRDYFQSLPSPSFSSTSEASTDENDLEIQRQSAFVQDALQFEDDIFWCNYVLSKSKARKLENEMQAKHARSISSDDEVQITGSRRKRSMYETASETPRKRKRDSKGYLPTPGLTPTKSSEYKIRQSIETQETNEESDEGLEGSEEDTLFIPNSRRPYDPFVSGDEDQSDDSEEAGAQTQLEKIRQKNLQHVKDNLPAIGQCTIFVGPECSPFQCASVALDKCQFLADRSHWLDEMGLHIFLHPEVDISRERFQPIGEYLKRRDFEPNFAKTFVTDRLEDFFMPEQSDQVAQRLILTYHTAARIQFEAVQKLCLRKLVLLDMLSPDTLLVLARVARATDKCGFDVDEAMLKWLGGRIARQYWKLTESSYMTLSRVMREDLDLSRRVFGILAQDPTIACEGLNDD